LASSTSLAPSRPCTPEAGKAVPAWPEAVLGSKPVDTVIGVGVCSLGALGTSSPTESGSPASAETSICVSSSPAATSKATTLEIGGTATAIGLAG
jgi:hypothetical protein